MYNRQTNRRASRALHMPPRRPPLWLPAAVALVLVVTLVLTAVPRVPTRPTRSGSAAKITNDDAADVRVMHQQCELWSRWLRRPAAPPGIRRRLAARRRPRRNPRAALGSLPKAQRRKQPPRRTVACELDRRRRHRQRPLDRVFHDSIRTVPCTLRLPTRPGRLVGPDRLWLAEPAHQPEHRFV